MNEPTSIPCRIGHGYDVHPLVHGRPLILGGCVIPCEYGLHGHSDADCLTHAIADALLGSLGLPDIGHAFPPSDPQWENMDSLEILKYAATSIRNRGYNIANIDSTLIAEKPKMGPHIEPMRTKLATTLRLSTDQIGIKATTHEKLGALGRAEGIAAHAVCLVHDQGLL